MARLIHFSGKTDARVLTCITVGMQSCGKSSSRKKINYQLVSPLTGSCQILVFEALENLERTAVTQMGRKSGFSQGCEHSQTGNVHG